MGDALDDLMRRPKRPRTKDEDRPILVVGRRAKSSAEIEERERAYLEYLKRLHSGEAAPIVFYLEDGCTPDEPTKDELAGTLGGVTRDEWIELFTRKPKGSKP